MSNEVTYEPSACQAGYRSGRGITNMLFVIQILIEMIRHTDEQACITFIDNSKAFDSVRHQHIFSTMLKMGFLAHLVFLIASLCDNLRQPSDEMMNTATTSILTESSGNSLHTLPHLFSVIYRASDLRNRGSRNQNRRKKTHRPPLCNCHCPTSLQ